MIYAIICFLCAAINVPFIILMIMGKISLIGLCNVASFLFCLYLGVDIIRNLHD